MYWRIAWPDPNWYAIFSTSTKTRIKVPPSLIGAIQTRITPKRNNPILPAMMMIATITFHIFKPWPLPIPIITLIGSIVSYPLSQTISKDHNVCISNPTRFIPILILLIKNFWENIDIDLVYSITPLKKKKSNKATTERISVRCTPQSC
jgi:hypothetical protein